MSTQPRKKADLLMHPVRMKIIQQLAKGPATTAELLNWIDDVPQATLYRHLNVLRQHEVVEVIAENPVRGTSERTYALRANATRITAEEAKEMSHDEHMEVFMTFVAELIRQTEEYVEGAPRFDADPFGYGRLDLYVTDSEWEAFQSELSQLLRTYGGLKKRKDARKVTMAQVFIPERRDVK